VDGKCGDVVATRTDVKATAGETKVAVNFELGRAELRVSYNRKRNPQMFDCFVRQVKAVSLTGKVVPKKPRETKLWRVLTTA